MIPVIEWGIKVESSWPKLCVFTLPLFHSCARITNEPYYVRSPIPAWNTPLFPLSQLPGSSDLNTDLYIFFYLFILYLFFIFSRRRFKIFFLFKGELNTFRSFTVEWIVCVTFSSHSLINSSYYGRNSPKTRRNGGVEPIQRGLDVFCRLSFKFFVWHKAWAMPFFGERKIKPSSILASHQRMSNISIIV